MRLSVGGVLSESFGFFFARLGMFFHLVTIPWILSLLLRVASSVAIQPTMMTGLAEQCMSEYDVDGWTDPAWLNPDDVAYPGLPEEAKAAE